MRYESESELERERVRMCVCACLRVCRGMVDWRLWNRHHQDAANSHNVGGWIADLHVRTSHALGSIEQSMTGERIGGWCRAPEVLSKSKYGEKADVYSFGVVLVEIYTSTIPYSELHYNPPQVRRSRRSLPICQLVRIADPRPLRHSCSLAFRQACDQAYRAFHCRWRN